MMTKRHVDRLLITLALFLAIATLCLALWKGGWIHWNRGDDAVRLKARVAGLDLPPTTSGINANTPTAPSSETVKPAEAPVATMPAKITPAEALASFHVGNAVGLVGTFDLKKVRIETVTEMVPLERGTVVEYSNALADGEEQVLEEGSDGEMQVSYRIVYFGDEVHEKSEIAHAVSRPVVDRSVLVGLGPLEQPTEVENIVTESAENTPPSDAQVDSQATPSENAQNSAQLNNQSQPLVTQAPEAAPPLNNPPASSQSVTTLSLTAPGSTASAEANYAVVASLNSVNGPFNYFDFEDNGDGTILVDGVVYSARSLGAFKTTCYDGYECAKVSGFAYGDVNVTASGMIPRRGMVASSSQFPMGTVLFIENYGFAVVADRHGMGDQFLDLAMDPYEISQGVYLPTANRRVYVLS